MKIPCNFLAMDAILKQLNVLETRVSSIESNANLGKPVKEKNVASCPIPKKAEPKPAADDEDDDVDLFGSDSDEENEAAAKVREERLAAYAAKKAKSK